MKNFYKRKLKFSLFFTTLIFLGISKLYAQPANSLPIIKYTINNYSSIAKAASDCDTCLPLVGKPLRTFRPIPLPTVAIVNVIPGVNINEIPGLATPNFLGGGSPEIKGLVKEVAGISDFYATSYLGKSNVLYFKNGAQGVAVSNSGKIFTSSLTIFPGSSRLVNSPSTVNGFFSFKSEPAILPKFNSTSEEVFIPSPPKVLFQGVQTDNNCLQVVYFALHPANENIVYAALKDQNDTTKILARKNTAGDWVELEWDIPGGLGLAKPVWGALAVDTDGNLYVADKIQHVIVKVTFDDNGKASSWKIIGGQMDTPGFVNDNNALNSRFNKPSGVCIDLAGNIYIGDAGNNVIRKINTNGQVTTYAGDNGGNAGSVDDNNWYDARFDGPTAVAYNEKTKTLYVVDFNKKIIREINQDRNVSTLAGLAGSLNPIKDPKGFAMNFYFVFAKLNVDPDEAKFTSPTSIAIDPSGLGLYVTDDKYIKYVNTSETIFRVTAAFGDSRANVLGLPILPLGIVMNPNNGSFFGVPLVSWEPTTYLISITNHVVTSSLLGLAPRGFITFEVVNCPDIPDTVIVNKIIPPNQLPYTWNKKIINDAGTTIVKLSGLYGCDSLVKLNLSLSPEVTYSSEPYILSLGQQIKPIVPATAGSLIDTFSVSPPLPDGLLLNAQTGEITGIPLAATNNQTLPVVGPQTPPQYPFPWTLKADMGADLTGFKISDGNGKAIFENNSAFMGLVGSVGKGTGIAGAYTDFSGFGAIKMFSNSPYSIQLSNALADGYTTYPLNQLLPFNNYMNSYAVYIDYNRDGNFDAAGERVYISAAPQTDAHTELFNLIIPNTATAGVTKMRIYAVEAATRLKSYTFFDPTRSITNQVYNVYRTTEQALSFYPFFNNISNFSATSGETDFHFGLDYGEFEDYNVNIVSPVTQSYLVTGSNALGSAQYTIKLAINKPSLSSTNLTICSNELPYRWNKLIFRQAGTQTDTLRNAMDADSLATLNLTVKQTSSSILAVANCGQYTYLGQVYDTSGDYAVHITNAAGCDSSIIFRFRQKATASITNLEIIPSQLPYSWNGLQFTTAGTKSASLTNAEGCDSTATLVLRVVYNIYYPAISLFPINKTITPLSPLIEGNYPLGVRYNAYNGYNISPALPNGLQIDPITGIISGTPVQLSALQSYTVTLLQDGAKPSIFLLSVGLSTASTTTINNCGPYTWNGVVYTMPITVLAPFTNQYGFDSTATLILSIRNLSASTTILNLNLSELPVIWNGDSITKEGLHTVHLVNAAGCDSAATADVVIIPKIFYASPQILQPNMPVAAITPQNLGGKVINYTITPSLVTGLQFDALTGTISGTPTDTLLQPVTHTVQAFNRAGTDTTKLVVAVCNPMATSFSMITCERYVWNDSTYTESTTHIRTLKNRGGCDSVVTMNLIIKKASKGPTDNITACVNYVWYGVKYNATGLYTKLYTNAVGCDSTIFLNLTIKNPTVNNRFVDVSPSDLPYTWRGKTFAVPGTQSIVLVNSVGCDSTLSMTVRISNVLPNISYAIKDTMLHWEKKIDVPITMTNTGTPVSATKLGELDTLINFVNSGPGNNISSIVKGPNGAYYATVVNSNQIFTLSASGVWSVFAGTVNSGSLNGPIATATFQQPLGLAFDAVGNLFVVSKILPDRVRKISPDGLVSTLDASPLLYGTGALSVDVNNNLLVQSQGTITKINLNTNQFVQMNLDYSPYFGSGELDMKIDSKGNMYILPNLANVIVKIRPNGQMSQIGSFPTVYQKFKPGNGPDAEIPSWISSMAIDSSNDNLYLMAAGQLLRVDTSENVAAVTGTWFEETFDKIFRVDNGKISIINNVSSVLYTANIYGVGSIPFMNNYGGNASSFDYDPKIGVNFKDFDKRIRLDSTGSIVGTPRENYTPAGNFYATNTSTAYSIIAANQYGISHAPMVISTKSITYKRESFVTTGFPYVWRGQSFNAPTDSATYLATNNTSDNDTLYMLHLVYEGAPQPKIISTRDCVKGEMTLTANTAGKNAISFDGTNVGIIKNLQQGGGGLGYFNVIPYIRPDGTSGLNFTSAFEVWIKPASVSGTQYILTRDTVKTHGTFFGLSIQNGKFVYEFTKGRTTPFVDYKLSSVSNIAPNVWTHVAASYYDSTLRIFINGQLEGTLQTPENSFNVFYNDSVTNRGVFPDFYLAGLGNQFGFKGEMDEFRAWGAKRDAAAINATINSIVNPSSARLGLYYRFDGDVSNGAIDISGSNRRATFIKPATSVSASGAPINFASYKWMPGGATTKSIVVNQASNTVYTLTVADYKGTLGSDSLLVAPIMQPAKVNCWDNYQMNTATCTWVNVGTQPVRPATACYQTVTFDTTICQWVVTGTQPARPATACYEIATFNATTCAWIVTGTKPTELAKANCWDNYQFNTTSCTWVNLGTQPVRPATACYQTATFDTTICQWVITGTQPARPATACYQTATFNTNTCQWVVTGTQPARPATACYEIATFNATTCAWVVTGTKPIEPAKANCWDNYQFNTTSCTWVNSGTQPARPTTACYQIATFNKNTCQWVVTGTQVSAGTNGTLSVCEETLLTTTQLFAALGGTPNTGGKWSPALAGAGIYTYTVAAIAPCTGSVTATVTVTAIARIINAGCYSATIARTYDTATNRTTFTYDVCANGCAFPLRYIAFITQTNTPVVSPINRSPYKTAKYNYKVSIPVGMENGKPIYGIKYEVSGKGINTNGECDKFIFTLAGNISKEAITVRFKAGNTVTNGYAECPSGYSKQTFITSQNKKIEQISGSNLTVKAYPNPYQDKVRFEINSTETGQGSLEVFNMLGQKVKTVYQGHIINGMQSFTLHLPEVLRSTLIYSFTVNGKQITGKLIYAGDR